MLDNEQNEKELEETAFEDEVCEAEEEQPAQEEETVEETSETAEDEKAKAPKKKERELKWTKKAKAKEEAEEKIREANDKYARLFAEFDNFRKRSEKEKTQRYDFGAKDMIERILPVLDNFERGLQGISEDQKQDSFVQGMEMIYKQLVKALEDAGVKPIEAVGKEFNPDFHNAVMHVEDEEAGDNIIVEEFQKGYMYKDQVVRYSMVKVAN